MPNADDIAIIGWNVSPMVRHTDKTEAQMLLEVCSGAVEHAGISRAEIDFTCAGSCDYVAGQAFSFVQNIDALGAWPPKRDSHVEMDGAWALYEAYVRLLLGDIDVAVAMGSGRSSTADPTLIYPMEMDPYYLAPLGTDAVSFAALQARSLSRGVHQPPRRHKRSGGLSLSVAVTVAPPRPNTCACGRKAPLKCSWSR